MLAYLCGCADLSEDAGKLWRRKLLPFLRDQLGHRVYDTAELAAQPLTPDEAAHFHTWQSTDLDRFRRASRKVIASNLDLVEHKADYLVCYWNPPGPAAGEAVAGVTAAHRKGIPVYLVAPLPAEEIDAWVLGCSDQVFTSVENLKGFLSSRYSREKQTVLWKE